MAKPLLLGHRGARKYAPENTLPALQLALDHGCDGFEFDVRLTSDGDAVVCHDPKFEGLVVERSTRDALTGRWHDENGLCGLDDVLERFQQAAFLNIELKVEGAEEYTLELLKRFPPAKGCIVSSFLPIVLEQLKQLGSEVPLGLICDSHLQLDPWRELPIAAVMAHRNLVTRTLIKEVHEAGKQVFVWTVNGATEMREFAEAGVDGIISDDTLLLGKTLNGASE
ncbi:MAG TPA: glycerophosphodiester phosphodiesterase [Terriglobales bacterium]|nr:glycerophosphodiester phosphodiesterase [Terriglobales bacterium]